MHGVQIDQDINCRILGRCTYGDFVDRERRDLTCCDAGFGCRVEEWQKAEQTSLDRDLGRAFLYARYTADLSGEGLNTLGCSQMDPEKVQKLDAVDQNDNLLQIGMNAGENIRLEHLGSFAKQPAAS
jgi:uncharacterized protein